MENNNQGTEKTHPCTTNRRFEDLPLLLVSYGILNCLHLHSYHRQNLHRDPVELIKASPHPCLGQSFINVTYGLLKATERTARIVE